jgi:hypothetical protein
MRRRLDERPAMTRDGVTKRCVMGVESLLHRRRIRGRDAEVAVEHEGTAR